MFPPSPLERRSHGSFASLSFRFERQRRTYQIANARYPSIVVIVDLATGRLERLSSFSEQPE